MELLPGAVEPAYFTSTTDTFLAVAPSVLWDDEGALMPGTWADPATVRPRRFSVDVAHPSAGIVAGARTLGLGVHTARIYTTEAGRTYVRTAPDTVVVKP